MKDFTVFAGAGGEGVGNYKDSFITSGTQTIAIPDSLQIIGEYTIPEGIKSVKITILKGGGGGSP